MELIWAGWAIFGLIMGFVCRHFAYKDTEDEEREEKKDDNDGNSRTGGRLCEGKLLQSDNNHICSCSIYNLRRNCHLPGSGPLSDEEKEKVIIYLNAMKYVIGLCQTEREVFERLIEHFESEVEKNG